jgi:NADH-quinone oxidoreductase subunit C
MNESAKTKSESRLDLLVENLDQRFGEKGCEVSRGLGEVTLVVPRDRLVEVATELRDAEEFLFEVLIDVCGVDYSTYGRSEWSTGNASFTGFGRGVERQQSPADASVQYAAVYHLLSLSNNQRMRLRVMVDIEAPVVDSVIAVWTSADWFEREAFDLYGILFSGHPDLRRILTDYGFVGHPFRKDFPLEGHVEMRYDREKQRVVYEPVSIEPRTLVPRVIREDNRFLAEGNEQQDPADA